MMTFNLRQSHYRYRPLRKNHTGWDVYALQSGLHGCGFGVAVDGLFGDGTDSAVRHFQTGEGLAIDGIAGILTQRAISVELGQAAELRHGLMINHMKGHLESECGFQLGNYTAPYVNATRDMGASQWNLPVTEENCRKAFDTTAVIERLAAFIRTRYDGYWRGGNNPFVKTRRRAWELAAAAWNRPAWTDKLARGEQLTPEQAEWVAGYIARTTVYVHWT